MESKEKLPPGWIKVKSKSRPGKIYFFNNKTQQAVWRIEDLMSPEKLAKIKQPSPKKAPDSHKLSSKSITIGKKNIAANRMKNLKMALEKEKNEEDGGAVKIAKPKSLPPNPKEKIPGKKQTVSPRKHASQKDPAAPESKKLKSPRKRVEEKDKLRSKSVEDMDVDMDSSRELCLEIIEDYEEPMDWEEIGIEEVVKEVNNIRSLKSIPSSLMPHDANKDGHSVDKFYIIVDTNIFCSNPSFIERIKGKVFKDIGKACILIPYIVLCELDLLKTRDGNIAKVAQRGIKAINGYFAAKDPFVAGQSIAEDTRDLIPIESGDDRILNYAFQLKEVTKNLLILSNDINLRNKAIVNGFESYSTDTLNYADFNASNAIKFK